MDWSWLLSVTLCQVDLKLRPTFQPGSHIFILQQRYSVGLPRNLTISCSFFQNFLKGMPPTPLEPHNFPKGMHRPPSRAAKLQMAFQKSEHPPLLFISAYATEISATDWTRTKLWNISLDGYIWDLSLNKQARSKIVFFRISRPNISVPCPWLDVLG